MTSKAMAEKFLIVLGVLLVGCASHPARESSDEYRVSIVLAHPDDETWLLGTLSVLKDKNAAIHVIYAANGDAGRDLTNRGLAGAALAKERKKEVLNVLGALGLADDTVFLGYADSTLKHNHTQVANTLAAIFQAHKPELIITFGEDGVTGHSDHIAIAKATFSAVEHTKLGSTVLAVAISESRALKINTIAKQYGALYRVKHPVSDSDIALSVNVASAEQLRASLPKLHRTQFDANTLSAIEAIVSQIGYEEFTVAMEGHAQEKHLQLLAD